jgi:dihydroorotase
MTRWWLAGGRVIDPASGIDAVGDLFLADGVVVAAPADRAGFARVDCDGCWVMPGFVDLHADLPDPVSDGRAARQGGFTTVVQTATPGLDRPLSVRDALARLAGGGLRVRVTPAATVGLAGTALADLGAFADLGVAAVSCGRTVLADATVLRGLFEYATHFDLPIWLRGAEPAFEQGFVKEGPLSARYGLPGVPAASEAIGIGRIAAIARWTGARVHLTHIWTTEGLDAVRAAQEVGVRLTASTTAAHLALDERRLASSGYAGWNRVVPPLGDEADRAALAAALGASLAAVATDHRPLPAVAQEVELALAEPGSVGFTTALPLVLSRVSDPSQVARALAVGPATVLGQVCHLRPGAPADVAVVDPAAVIPVGDGLGSRSNTPLRGESWRGAVRWSFCAGAPLADAPRPR